NSRLGKREREKNSWCYKGNPLFHLNAPDSLDKYIIGVATEGEWQGEGVGPRGLGGGGPVSSEKVGVDLPEIADLQRQKGRGPLNERFEDLCAWLLTYVGDDRTGIETMGGSYAFHRRSSCVFSSCLRRANASLLVRVWRKHPMVRATTSRRCSTVHEVWA